MEEDNLFALYAGDTRVTILSTVFVFAIRATVDAKRLPGQLSGRGPQQWNITEIRNQNGRARRN